MTAVAMSVICSAGVPVRDNFLIKFAFTPLNEVGTVSFMLGTALTTTRCVYIYVYMCPTTASAVIIYASTPRWDLYARSQLSQRALRSRHNSSYEPTRRDYYTPTIER